MHAIDIDCPTCKAPPGSRCSCQARIKAVVSFTREANLAAKFGIEHAHELGRPVEFRSLGAPWSER